MGDKLPLGVDLHFKVSKPYVAITLSNKKVIAQDEALYNAHDDLIHHQERIINPDPTEEELFKVSLANPQEERRISWDYMEDECGPTGYTLSSFQTHLAGKKRQL